MTSSVGLDVGGAHLKIAVLNDGRINSVDQITCPLWKGLEHLHEALEEVRPAVEAADSVGITMTGELSDLFPDRATGVSTLIDELTEKLRPDLHVWRGEHGFGAPDHAKSDPRNTGSTNFLASAAYAAGQIYDGVLIDFGSTTTDIIPFADGKPIVTGTTDGERLTSGELVYTGMTRTSVMGVATAAPFRGQWQTLAREHLATMADVRRILGELPKGLDNHETADGRSKSTSDSIARFARMFGRDKSDGTVDDWSTAAAFIREAQVRSIHDDLIRVLAQVDIPLSAPVVAAGIGSDTARVLAHRVGRASRDFGVLAHADKRVLRSATRAAPAVAIAHLVAHHADVQESCSA